MGNFKKGGVILTNHSKRRARQRVGLTKNQTEMSASRAFKFGIRHSEVKQGELREWMTAEYFKYKTANNCIYYANHLYLFHNSTLITILSAENRFEESLQDFVELKAYIRYKWAKYVKKRDFQKKQTEYTKMVFAPIYNEVKEKMEEILSKEKYANYTFSNVDNFQIFVRYATKKRNPKLEEQLEDEIFDTFGLYTVFVKQREEV